MITIYKAQPEKYNNAFIIITIIIIIIPYFGHAVVNKGWKNVVKLLKDRDVAFFKKNSQIWRGRNKTGPACTWHYTDDNNYGWLKMKLRDRSREDKFQVHLRMPLNCLVINSYRPTKPTPTNLADNSKCNRQATPNSFPFPFPN